MAVFSSGSICQIAPVAFPMPWESKYAPPLPSDVPPLAIGMAASRCGRKRYDPSILTAQIRTYWSLPSGVILLLVTSHSLLPGIQTPASWKYAVFLSSDSVNTLGGSLLNNALKAVAFASSGTSDIVNSEASSVMVF